MGDCAFVVFNTSIITGKAVLCFLFFIFICMRVDTIMYSVVVHILCVYAVCLYRNMYSQILLKWVQALAGHNGLCHLLSAPARPNGRETTVGHNAESLMAESPGRLFIFGPGNTIWVFRRTRGLNPILSPNVFV